MWSRAGGLEEIVVGGTLSISAAFLFWRAMMGITEALYLPAAAGLILCTFSR